MDFNSYNSYDIVFDLKSLSNLKEGFPIIYSKIIKEQFDEIKEERGIVVTAIGNSNKGKTYILSKIFEIKLPFGSTKGISIKYPHNFFIKKIQIKDLLLLTLKVLKKQLQYLMKIKMKLIN